MVWATNEQIMLRVILLLSGVTDYRRKVLQRTAVTQQIRPLLREIMELDDNIRIYIRLFAQESFLCLREISRNIGKMS
jgi:hypothetical protein